MRCRNMRRVGSLVSILGILLLVGCRSEHDLTAVCQSFDALEREPALSTMGYAQRMAFVDERVSGSISRFGSVTRLWRLLPNSVPEARYRMFKRSADELVGAWNCPAMERLAPSLSEPVVGSE